MPIASIISYHSTTIPVNYLFCDGSVFDSLVYPALFDKLGTNTLPDLRGAFVRGWDPTAVNDPDGASRVLGTM